MRSKLLPALAGVALLAGCAEPVATTHGASKAEPALNLHARNFGLATPSDVRTLVVVLHGDGSPETRSDHYRFAESVTENIPGSAAVALLRPGYGDAAGNRSPGQAGLGFGDDYTQQHIDAVAQSLGILRRRFPAARLILVGDSGGAAIAADIAGIRPDLLDAMVLVGCPCALPEWRKGMEKQRHGAAWATPVASLDPLKTAGGVMPSMRAAVLVGLDDKITPPSLSRAYAEALALRGIATDLRIVPGRGHDLLNDPEVLAATTRLATALPTKG
ncbi:alpha/beta hydrolase [Sphingomonas sp. TDK1]|uniref:alpha/beta hydrolase n=1 Tax=Sphingomonas sp. TDK1 TaxID=453247 RepID=UPI000AEF35F7|nr:alpha/beta hydrolase [Sphingomonas sp. TDK1]